MPKFMIGQYGGFDFKKYHRDFKDGFYGIEACLFEHESDKDILIEQSQKDGFHIGIHFPLRAGRSTLRDALFLSTDTATREQAYELVGQELEYLVQIKPDYVLFHYPKPVILDDQADCELWRFSERREYVYESEFSFEEFKEKSELLFQWLTAKAIAYDFTPILEFDGLNKYIYESDFLVQLLQKYENIKLCLDTGRLSLQERTDPKFDAKNLLKKYAKYAENVHLWNLQIVDNKIIHIKYPVLPNQEPADGWAPIEEYLNIIKQENPDVRILFEHRSELVSDEELENCYSWVKEIFNN